MHAVRCPNCKKVLRLKQPVHEARMRCRHCGEIFVGTSREVSKGGRQVARPADGDPLQSPPPPLMTPQPMAPPEPFAPPPAPRGYAPQAGGRYAPQGGPYGPAEPELPMYVRKQASPVPLIIVCIAGLGIIALIVGAVWVHNHPKLVIRDDRGGEEARRMPREQAEALRKQKMGDSGAEEPIPPHPVPGGGGPVSPPPRLPPAGGDPASVAPPPPSGVDPDTDNMKQPDANMLAQMDRHVTSDERPGEGYIAGRVISKYDYPLEYAEISVYTYDASNQRRRPFTTRAHYIPPNGETRFSVPYNALTKDQIHDIRVVAHSPKRAATNVVSWTIPATHTQKTDNRGVVEITGQVKNKESTPLRNIQIYYNVFDPEGVDIFGVAKVGKLDNAVDSLPPGGQVNFRCSFKPSDKDFLTSSVKDWVIRVWASK